MKYDHIMKYCKRQSRRPGKGGQQVNFDPGATGPPLPGASANGQVLTALQPVHVNGTPVDENNNLVAKKKRNPMCARCKNHNKKNDVKGHKRRCQFSKCVCDKCLLIVQRQKIMAKQVALRREQQMDEDLGRAPASGCSNELVLPVDDPDDPADPSPVPNVPSPPQTVPEVSSSSPSSVSSLPIRPHAIRYSGSSGGRKWMIWNLDESKTKQATIHE